MRSSKRIATLIGLVCGAELIVAILIGGAGVGALLGWDSAVLAVAIVSLIAALVYQHRKQKAVNQQSLLSKPLDSQGRFGPTETPLVNGVNGVNGMNGMTLQDGPRSKPAQNPKVPPEAKL